MVYYKRGLCKNKKLAFNLFCLGSYFAMEIIWIKWLTYVIIHPSLKCVILINRI